MRRFASLVLAGHLAACATPKAPSSAPETPAGQVDAPPGSVAARPDGSVPSEGTATENPLLDERPSDPLRGLPRLSVKNVGLHVGGGTGSAEERQALLAALGQGEQKVLACYRRVERPGVGGTFGSDLYVPAAGGHPQIRSTRQKLGGADFEECMMKALESTTFGPQARPLVISYSVRFELSS